MTNQQANHSAYIGIGSNLDTPKSQVERALSALAAHRDIDIEKVSNLYLSKAIGPDNQPDYVNGAVHIKTTLSPMTLLDTLQDIEQQQGRIRNERWGARTLDLDILLYQNHTIDTDRLTIPHPELANRNFVILPLLDIDTKLTLPNGQKIADILPIIGAENIKKIQ